MKQRASRPTAAVVAAALGLGVIAAPGFVAAGPSGAAIVTQGVTKTTISLGVNVIDFSSVAQFTHGLTQGDFQGAYTALIDQLNKHGGIGGRKVVPTFVTTNPIRATSGDASCTQLTEDVKVFAVTGEFSNNLPCFLETHPTPVVGGEMSNSVLAKAAAPWVSTAPNNDLLEPAAVAAAAQAGVFKGKKVGVLDSADDPPSVVSGIAKALRQHGVRPTVTSTLENNTSDAEATVQQVEGVVVPKFQSDGVDVVIASGATSISWIDATGSGSYHPQLMASNFTQTSTTISGGSKVNPVVVAHAVSAYTKPLVNAGKAIGWADPSLQHCVQIAKSAGVKFKSPVVAKGEDESYEAVVTACDNLALFSAIATKAGTHLTAGSFAAAADHLGPIEIPGLGMASYDKANPAGSFPLFLYRWDGTTQQWAASANPYGMT